VKSTVVMQTAESECAYNCITSKHCWG